MKAFFAAAGCVLVLLSVVAWRLQPRPPAGKVPLIWVSDDNPARREQIGLFNRLHPTYDLRLDPSAGLEKVILQCLAGVGPDLFDSYGPSQLDAYIRSGAAWDLTDALARRGLDLSGRVYPSALSFGTRHGRVYGFPTNISVDALWFHKDLFAQARVPSPKGPWTWQ